MTRVDVAGSAVLGNRRSAAGVWNVRELAFIVATGCMALAVGVIVYLSDRAASSAQLIPHVEALSSSNAFGGFGQWLPSFIHPFAFGLFTAAALPPVRAGTYGACAAWCAVNIAFEIGQHAQVSAGLSEALIDAFGQTAATQPIASYFLRGTFDGGDIAAAMLGAAAAAGVLRLMRRQPENDRGT